MPPIRRCPASRPAISGGTYDAAEPNTAWDAYQDYGHNHWHNSLLWGEDIHDFSITGPGLIWGKGLSNGEAIEEQMTRLSLLSRPASATRRSRSRTATMCCLRDFSILKAGHFGLLLTGVDNLTIDNLKIDTDRDGMDIDCCQNVRVSNCTVNSPWDDGICPKSSYALGYARPTRNVTITNCWVTGYYELGSVLDGTFKKFAPECACAAHRPHQVRDRIERRLHQYHDLQLRLRRLPGLRAGIGGWRAAGRHHHHQHHHARSFLGPLFMRLGARLRGPKESTKVGTLKRILISNLDCYNAPHEDKFHPQRHSRLLRSKT